MSDIDSEKVITVLIVFIVFLSACIFIGWLYHEHTLVPLKEECSKNPQLRYAVACTTPDDCIKKCVEKLSSG